jgi:hypothetical protein
VAGSRAEKVNIGQMRVVVIDEGVSRMLNRAPKYANAEINKAFRKIGTVFMSRWANARLRGRPGIRVVSKNKARRAKSRKGMLELAMPRVAKVMGFYSRILRSETLHEKELRMGTSNPVMLAHEEGARITRGSKWLSVLVRTPQGASRAAKSAGGPVSVGDWLRVGSVDLPPRLGFRRAWRVFEPQAINFLKKSIDALTQRLQNA